MSNYALHKEHIQSAEPFEFKGKRIDNVLYVDTAGHGYLAIMLDSPMYKEIYEEYKNDKLFQNWVDVDYTTFSKPAALFEEDCAALYIITKLEGGEKYKAKLEDYRNS